MVTVLEWPKDDSGGHDGDALRVYLATSRDAINYDLSFIYSGGKPMIEPGPKGSFDSVCHLPSSQFVTTEDQHWLYYEGCPSGHETQKKYPCKIGLVKFRLDGFGFVSPRGRAWGNVVTRPFRVAGSSLRLNVAEAEGPLHKGGCLTDDLYDVRVSFVFVTEDRELAGFGRLDGVRVEPGINSTVTWRHRQLANLVGEAVRMVVWLRCAKLHAFQFFAAP